MVFTTLYPRIYFRFASVLVLFSIQLSSSHEYSDLISRLNKPSHDHQPLVLVLDSHGHLKSANSKSSMYQENRDEKELSLPLLLKQLSQAQNNKFSPKFRKPRHHQHDDHLDRRPGDREDRQSLDRDDDQRTNKDSRNERPNHDHIHDRHDRDKRIDRDQQDRREDRDDRDRRPVREHRYRLDDKEKLEDRERREDRDRHGDHGKRDESDRRDRDRKDHHSPVIKSLLRISNSLRCGARNQCEDECSNSYKGKKKDECEDECEKNISCEEEEEKDECAQSDEEDQCEGSTKGVTFRTTTPKCKRC